jgi:hypothetical protein
MAIVQAIYGLDGRQTQGFLQSVFELMKLNLTAPDHSTLSRRRWHLMITLPIKNLSKSLHFVVDSTGVNVYGEGEWKARQHGVGKRRSWRKLNLCTDEATMEIVGVVASMNDVSDAEALPDLLQDVPVNENVKVIHFENLKLTHLGGLGFRRDRTRQRRWRL